jgi:hypothetical protein
MSQKVVLCRGVDQKGRSMRPQEGQVTACPFLLIVLILKGFGGNVEVNSVLFLWLQNPS